MARTVKPEPSFSIKAKPRTSEARAVESDEEEEEVVPSPKARKRVKKNRSDEEDHQAEEQEGEDQDLQHQAEQQDEEDHKPMLLKDTDGYVKGSIVRIKCQAFVTYDAVEFRPGPALNMILGPNGTGKSTIACAIAIGLNFPTKVLGRATKLSEFCKKDSTAQTWIEIELKSPPGRGKNMIVRRTLNRDSESSTFSINGSEVTARDVSERMSQVGVQVGNLCTFLPQDRVAAFSQMSHTELLRETERAAGDENLSHWHELLIEEFTKQKKFQIDVDRHAEALRRRETKQADNEKEVRQFEERERVEHELAVISLLLQYAHYNDKFAKWTEAKEQRNKAVQELRQLEGLNKPFRESQEGLSNAIAEFKTIIKTREDKKRKLAKKLKDCQIQIDSSAEGIEKTKEAVKTIRSDEANTRKTIDQAEKDLAKIEKQLAAPVDDRAEELSKVEAIIRAKVEERSEKKQRAYDLEEELKANRPQLNSLVKDISTAETRLKEQDNAVHQRERELQQFESDAWRATLWLRENKHKFKGNVYEPPRLSLFLKRDSTQFASLVEAPIPLHAFKTFLFDTREDYNFMMEQINDRAQPDGTKLRINGSQIEPNMSRDQAKFKPQCNQDDLKRMGFDCYATDLLDGPEPVLTWLSYSLGLGKMPLQLRSRDIDQQAVNRCGFTRYYTPEGSHSVTVSKYGQRKAQVEQRRIQTAKIIISGGAGDTARTDELKAKLATLNAQKRDELNKAGKIQRQIEDLKQQAAVVDEERKDAIKEKENLLAAERNRAKCVAKKTQLTNTIKREKARPSVAKKRADLNAKLAELTDKQLNFVSKHNTMTIKYVTVQIKISGLIIRLMQAENDLKAMDSSSNEQDQALMDKQEEVEQLKRKVKEYFSEAQRINNENDEAAAAADESVRKAVGEARTNGEVDLETLTTRHAEAEARLNVTVAISPEIVRRYNEGKQDVARMKQTLETSQAELEASTVKINQVRGRWVPALKRLIGRICDGFRAAFDNLGLLGEVRLAEDPDYSKWGIEILVSFRDGEPLKVLTSHRQSGGERALTTVMYLMSLAELAKAPFALVDEINQGMDQRVERQVHNALVKTTSKPGVGQYFLLTPKLLPDLEYDPSMKVLTINSGPWLPQAGQLSLADLVKKRQRRNAATANA